MAVVLALTEQSLDAGKWIHFGATSNDILDTATALQIKDALLILRKETVKLRQVLIESALSHKIPYVQGALMARSEFPRLSA